MAVCGWCKSRGLKVIPNPAAPDEPSTKLENHAVSSSSTKHCQGPATWLSIGETVAAKSRGI